SRARPCGAAAPPIQLLSGQELRIALPRKSEPFAGRSVQRRPHCPTSKEPPGARAKGLDNLVSNPTEDGFLRTSTCRYSGISSLLGIFKQRWGPRSNMRDETKSGREASRRRPVATGSGRFQSGEATFFSP